MSSYIYIFSIGKSHLEHSVGAMGRCACPGDRVVLEISGCGPVCAGSDIPAGRAPGPSENPYGVKTSTFFSTSHQLISKTRKAIDLNPFLS